MIGGYQIIDFGGVTLSSTKQVIKGVYRKASCGKPIIVQNFKVSTTLYAGSYICQRVKSSTNWVLYVPNTKTSNTTYYTITIESDDKVSIT